MQKFLIGLAPGFEPVDSNESTEPLRPDYSAGMVQLCLLEP